MAYTLLLKRIEELWAAKASQLGHPLSERKLCVNAGVGIKSIYSLKQGHAPKADTLAKLADYFGVSREYLLAAADSGLPVLGLRTPALQMTTIAVKGAVQAGVWREAVEWPIEDWRTISVPVDTRWPAEVERFSLLVVGTSMDRFYPDGTFVLVINFYDLGRGPKPGERVVAIRRSSTGDFEATIKEYQVDGRGRHILWPRSSDPEHQTPVILSSDDAPLAKGNERLPESAVASNFTGDSDDEIIIRSLVVGSYRQE